MSGVKLKKQVLETKEFRRMFYWNGFMLGHAVRDCEVTLELTLLTMIGTGGFGVDEFRTDRRDD